MTLSLEKRTAISDSIRFELAGRCFVDPLFSSREEGTACDFLDFVYILEPPPGRGRIRFTRWDHLIDIAEKLTSERLIVILKARQIGFSWLIAAYAAWLARFHEGAVILMLSKGQDEAKALLGKVRFILVNLPDTWQVKFGADSKSEIEIPEMNSKIVALPATEDAGRSETATVVVQDEADFHEYLDANYAAVKPTIDAGGQLIQGSTSNKRKMISLFKELYRGAPDNGYAKVFLGWDVRPCRDKKWYAQLGVPLLVPARPDVPAQEHLGVPVVRGSSIQLLKQGDHLPLIRCRSLYELSPGVDGRLHSGVVGVEILVEVRFVLHYHRGGLGPTCVLSGRQRNDLRVHLGYLDLRLGVGTELHLPGVREVDEDEPDLAEKGLRLVLPFRQHQYNGPFVEPRKPRRVGSDKPGETYLPGLQNNDEPLRGKLLGDIYEMVPPRKPYTTPAGRRLQDVDKVQKIAGRPFLP